MSESMSINYLPVTSLSSGPGTAIVLVDLNEATLTVVCPLTSAVDVPFDSHLDRPKR